jgi:hypothetical protein
MSDVTNCVSSLKKVVQDLRSIAAQEGQLQMANPIARLAQLFSIPKPTLIINADRPPSLSSLIPMQLARWTMTLWSLYASTFHTLRIKH